MVQPLRVPIVDLSLLRQRSDHTNSPIIKDIHEACRNIGFFHVVHHGIPESVIEGALEVNSEFFNLPTAIKEELISDDVLKPVRFGKLVGEDEGNSKFMRDFLKLCAYPFEDFEALWPTSPPNYREKMGMYSSEVRKVSIEIFEVIMESLNLGATYMRENFNQGCHILGINSYPPCSESDIKAGITPHTDYGLITILLQTHPGLEVVDRTDGKWKVVPEVKGSLQVLVGDQLQVMSNGLYRSVVHRAIPSHWKTRMSIASAHSLAMDEVVEPAMKLLDEGHPKAYKESSLREYLKHLSVRQTRTFIETLQI
ncbi:unnamed protein product [Ilex paraguariensis]|uniref:Fe2OG dioxygenase domain-containing protein n=1 Tax=Ilex paraguariensis TaxID=185542 RepID=A0ABC8TV50_9AQUA